MLEFFLVSRPDLADELLKSRPDEMSVTIDIFREDGSPVKGSYDTIVHPILEKRQPVGLVRQRPLLNGIVLAGELNLVSTHAMLSLRGDLPDLHDKEIWDWVLSHRSGHGEPHQVQAIITFMDAEFYRILRSHEDETPPFNITHQLNSLRVALVNMNVEKEYELIHQR